MATIAKTFEGKAITITGAASGIGLAVAQYLAQRRATLSLAHVQETALLKFTTLLLTESKMLLTTLDVRDRAAVDSWMEKTAKKCGPLSGAASLAGVPPKGFQTLTEVDDDAWDCPTAVNLNGTA